MNILCVVFDIQNMCIIYLDDKEFNLNRARMEVTNLAYNL